MRPLPRNHVLGCAHRLIPDPSPATRRISDGIGLSLEKGETDVVPAPCGRPISEYTTVRAGKTNRPMGGPGYISSFCEPVPAVNGPSLEEGARYAGVGESPCGFPGRCIERDLQSQTGFTANAAGRYRPPPLPPDRHTVAMQFSLPPPLSSLL
jgi:hypothetical protein